MSLTKQDLKDVANVVAKQNVPVEKRLSESIAGLNRNFTKRQDGLDKRLGGVEKHLEIIGDRLQSVESDVEKIKHAVVDLLGTERYVRNLVKELKAQGIKLDEKKVFAT